MFLDQNTESFPDYRDNSTVDYPSESYIQPPIELTRWDKYYPYQLLILKAQSNSDNTVSYIRTGMRFTLPIPPQELSIEMPIATTVQPTLTGIIEQHGGVPFRIINLQGTTGINPSKGTQGGIFNDVSKLTDLASQKNVSGPIGTGYAQWHLLYRFLESYENMKTHGGKLENVPPELKDSESLRLALAIWKDNSVYICSGTSLSCRRSASSPLEYMFNLQLKAWRRVSIKDVNIAPYEYPTSNNLDILARIGKVYNKARKIVKTVDATLTTILGASSGIQEIMRECDLYFKKALNDTIMISDLPSKIVESCFGQVKSDWQTPQSNLKNFLPGRSSNSFLPGRPSSGFSSNNPSTSSTLLNTLASQNKSLDAKAGRASITTARLGSPVGSNKNGQNKAINSPDIQKMLDNMSYKELSLNPTVKAQINNEIKRTQNFTRYDFEQKRDKLQQALDLFTDKVGAGSLDYHTTFNLSTSSMTSRTPINIEWDIIFNLSLMIQCLSYMAATSQTNPQNLSSFDFVAGLSEQSGIAFKKPISKILVPFPYGFTLEQLALKYLGDANRWEEIALLNGLRNPYIDEEGFTLNLVNNGSENKVVVEQTQNIIKNQIVWIYGNTVKKEKRTVIDIDILNNNLMMLTLDGDSDLSKYLLTDYAKIETFLPGTINSQKSLFIPSDQISTQNLDYINVPGINTYDPLIQISGVDLLLTQDGDLAITGTGDCRLAYGLNKIIQDIKIAIQTPKGSLLQHPEFGFPIEIGGSLNDVSAKDILGTIREFFNTNPQFAGTRGGRVDINQGTINIQIEVLIAGMSQYLPLNFSI